MEGDVDARDSRKGNATETSGERAVFSFLLSVIAICDPLQTERLHTAVRPMSCLGHNLSTLC